MTENREEFPKIRGETGLLVIFKRDGQHFEPE
jgi:hypothetical protein